MRFTDLPIFQPETIVRDGHFSSLGFITHDSPDRLVALFQEKFLDSLLLDDQITCVITSNDLKDKIPENLGLLVMNDPLNLFYMAHEFLVLSTDFYWEKFPSQISADATIHLTADVATENVRIGPGTTVAQNVAILERTVIGTDVVIEAGAVIGRDGTQLRTVDGQRIAVPHAGGVRLGDRVVIEANSVVERSLFGGFTEIGRDTRVDSLVRIAHNVIIGERCIIKSAAIISGSTIIGDDTWIGANATLSDGLKIGKHAHIALGSVVLRDLDDEDRVFGNPASPRERRKLAATRQRK